MKVLLTGATGFLGSHLLQALLEAGHDLIILKRSFSDTWRINRFMDDICCYDLDTITLKDLFQRHGKIDTIIHTATNYGRNGETASEIFETNASFPLNLLETAASLNTDTFFNTDTVLYNHLNYYALSKNHFKEWGRHFALMNRIRFVNIKLEHMYGPNDDDSKFTDWVVQNFLNDISELPLTKGEQKRDFIYIDDVVHAYLTLLDNCLATKDNYLEYHLGSGNTITIRKFVETLHLLTNSSTQLNFGAIPYRVNETMNSCADISKLRQLGWKPECELTIGLKKLIDAKLRKM